MSNSSPKRRKLLAYRAADAAVTAALALVVVLSPHQTSSAASPTHFWAAISTASDDDLPEFEYTETRLDNSSPSATGTGFPDHRPFNFRLADIDPDRARAQASWNLLPN